MTIHMRAATDSERARALQYVQELAALPIEANWVDELDKAWRTLNSPIPLWEAFMTEFDHAAKNDATFRYRCTSGISYSLTEAMKAPNLLVSSVDHRQAQAEFEYWKTAHDPFIMWKFSGGANYQRPPTLAFQLLQALNEEIWLEVLDRLPSPGVGYEIIWHSRLSEGAVILRLLANAPKVFDEDGRWTRSIAAMLLLERVGAYATTLKDVEATQSWFRRAFRTVYRRFDGQRLCLGLLECLCGMQLPGNYRATTPEEMAVVRTAIEITADVLVRNGLEQRHVCDFWQERERMGLCDSDAHAPRYPRVVGLQDQKKLSPRKGLGARTLYYDAFNLCDGAARILERRSAVLSDAEGFWQWFRQLLKGRAGGLHRFLEKGALNEYGGRFGHVLARLPEPWSAWSTAYQELEPQRRRDRFTVNYECCDSHEPSLILILVGLFGCAATFEAKGNSTRGVLQDWFWLIYDAARHLWLTNVLADSGAERLRERIVPLCFAFIPRVFREDIAGALERAVPAIANDPLRLGLSAAYLLRNGVEPGNLRDLFAAANVDIALALETAYQWSKATKQPNEFPPECESVARALGLKFADSDSLEQGSYG